MNAQISHICLTVDKNVVSHALVSAFSFLKHSPDNVHIHMVCLKDGSASHLNLLAKNKRITIHQVDFETEFRVDRHITKTAYLRLYLHKLLPDSIDTVIYVDTDTLAIDSINELLSFKLSHPVAACDHLQPEESLRLFGPTLDTYFQSGVLIMDLKWMRSNEFTLLLKNCYEAHSELILWHDQDLLNLLLKGNIQRLPANFNYTYDSFFKLPNIKPSVIHFSGGRKPWKKNKHHPFKDLWLAAYEEATSESASDMKSSLLTRFRAMFKWKLKQIACKK